MRTRVAAWLLAGAVLLAVLPPALAQRGNPRMEFGGRSIDAMIADYMAEHTVPGLSLAIVQAPYIPRATGHGVADTEKTLLVGSNTLFDVGEMADAYVAVAAMQLVEAGKLALDQPARKHLPDLPAAWDAVTVRDLLMHASGLPDYRQAPSYDPGRSADPASLSKLVADMPLAAKPGQEVAYSATDYLLLARAVEAASGRKLRDFIRENQFDRLGLRHTVFADEIERIRSEAVERNGNRHKDFLVEAELINPVERATGYREEGGRLTPETAAAAAGYPPILASAMDVSIWDIGLAGGILVKDPALRAVLYGPAKSADGRTWPVMGAWRFPGRKGLMYVTGSARGQSAFLSRFTAADELVCVTLLANREGLDLSQLGRRIAGAYDKRLGPPEGPGLRVQQSPYPPGETMERFRAALRRDKLAEPAAARAWESDGQVWVGYVDRGAAERPLRDRLDRALLLAVSPY
jgi:D-alanyl-D-alanine carboxypeptidase